MVSTPQLGVSARLASMRSTVSADPGPAPTQQHDVHVMASRTVVPRLGDRSGGTLSWIQLFRVTSFWESALIAALFLLISGLVGLRLAAALSDRDIDASSLPLMADAVGDRDDSEQPPNDTHRGYESYLSPETPSRLLSDEGEVVRLLIANHGRIRQHRITERTGWSKSKVSRICSRMHADGTIEKRSVGRENVITLADRPATREQATDEVETPAQ